MEPRVDQPLILIVEDNPETRSFLVKVLADSGRIEVAVDGEDGLQKAAELEPDLIISDLMMPRMSGSEMIRALRADPRFQSTPVLVLSAKTDESLRVEMLHGLAQEYVTKPCGRAELAARVHNLLKIQRHERQMHALAARLISAQELERRRIARELHDDFSQRIAALCMDLSLLEERPPDSSAEVNERIHSIGESLGDLARDMQLLSRGLHSSVLQNVGLEAALSTECTEISQRHKIAIDFTCESMPPSLSEDVALCIFRVAQEALHNVVKHSQAYTASVNLVCGKEGISLTIKDQGEGFNPGQVIGGLGLISMRERVRPFGGRVSIVSAAGEGTEVSLFIRADRGGRA